MPETLNAYKDEAIALLMAYLPKVVLALLTLWIGSSLIRGLVRFIRQTLEKRGYDPSLVPFLCNLTSWLFKAVLFISVASMVGVQTTSFIAILGAAGLAVGLALQGSLGNFAGGVLILVFRPFKVGDVIEAQGHIGVVKEIQIFTTVLLNGQNRRIVIPNGKLSNDALINYNVEGRVRVDFTVGIGYEADIDQAKSVLLALVKDDKRVLAEPAPMVAVAELGDSSVNLALRVHCNPDDYWGIYFDGLEAIKKTLDKNNISIPFPQRDVHLHQKSA
jgi:small conductance mechanosensitive channel